MTVIRKGLALSNVAYDPKELVFTEDDPKLVSNDMKDPDIFHRIFDGGVDTNSDWARWVIGNEDDPTAAQVNLIQMGPNLEGRRHYHLGTRVEFLLEGSIFFDDVWYHAPRVTVFPANVPYGPVKSGAEGATLISFYGDRGGMPDVVTES